MTRFSQIKTVGLSLVAGVIFMTPSANANGPVALVEYITVQSAGIGFMDFFVFGQNLQSWPEWTSDPWLLPILH